jgi:hypothetical protein
MIIFRSSLIEHDRLQYVFTSANDLDIIGVEVTLDGNVLIDCSMDQHGATNVLFDTDGGQMEFDLNDLRTVLEKCERELSEWRDRLLRPGELWDGSKQP